ncbi:hypothetical protein [Pedobacter sp. AJM]|uniref:hypothetical protein n=1 Tax=Pedobacter sp. AJM TaxID=2003629 RepID=UPI000B4BC0E9|nr:hypothetical protein [Pedobacter sp. AJM]OWK68796.1 hypothetical protein CBW18_20205 [Pedobacter sp. AJM]
MKDYCSAHLHRGEFIVKLSSPFLYYQLNAYIFQEESYEGTTLNFSAEMTNIYKMVYDWLADCDALAYYFKQRIQIN